VRPSFADLPWLAPPPDDFNLALSSLGTGEEAVGAGIQRLAQTQLQPRQSAALGRKIGRLKASGADLAPLS